MSEDTNTSGAADENAKAPADSTTTTENASTETTGGDTAPTSDAPADAAQAPSPAPAETKPADAAPPAPPAPAADTLQVNPIAAGILHGLRDRMAQYIAAMSRAVPTNVAKGSRQQLDLYRLILDILRQEGSVFMKAWSDFLAAVHENRNNAFAEGYAYRFINEIAALSKDERRSFMNLIHLAVTTADPKSRGTMLRSIDMRSVTANIPLPGAADKLISFYSP